MIALEPQRLGHRGQHALHLGGEHGAHLRRGDLLVVAALRKGLGDAHGGLDAQIRLDQQVLQLLQRISVELPLGEDAGNVFGELGRRLGQSGLEALEPAQLLRRRLGGGWRRELRLGRGGRKVLLQRGNRFGGLRPRGCRLSGRTEKQAEAGRGIWRACRSQSTRRGEQPAMQLAAGGPGDAGPQQLPAGCGFGEHHLDEAAVRARRSRSISSSTSPPTWLCRCPPAPARPSPAAVPPAP